MFLRDIQAKSGMVGNYDVCMHSSEVDCNSYNYTPSFYVVFAAAVVMVCLDKKMRRRTSKVECS